MRARANRWQGLMTCGAAVWALACGATTSGSEPQAAAGTSQAGTNSGGALNSGGGNAAGGTGSVTDVPLEPGSCGVVRTIRLPETPYSAAPVTRQGTRFALGPWKEGEQASQLRAFMVDESGRNPRSFEATGSTNDVSWPAFLGESKLALEVFLKTYSGGGDDTFGSRVWSNQEEVALARGEVLNAQWRGTNAVTLLPTLDGKRAIFAMWPYGLSEPRAAVIGPDGARAGDELAFSEPERNTRCAALLPTAHGGFVSFVDSHDDLRLFELGPDGELVREATWPLPSVGTACPSFALAEGGLVFLLDLRAPELPGDVRLYRFDESDAVTEIVLPSPFPAREVAMLGGDPLLLRWSPKGAELSRPRHGELWPITLPKGFPRRVASEPGNLWLDIEELDQPRTVVQLSCR